MNHDRWEGPNDMASPTPLISIHPRGQRASPPATVALATAARALGISPHDACDLAERGEFPCQVVKSGGGYRVPFAALLGLLGPNSHDGHETESAP